MNRGWTTHRVPFGIQLELELTPGSLVLHFHSNVPWIPDVGAVLCNPPAPPQHRPRWTRLSNDGFYKTFFAFVTDFNASEDRKILSYSGTLATFLIPQHPILQYHSSSDIPSASRRRLALL